MKFDIKLILAVIGVVLLVIGYIPYFRDVFQGKTKPHLYTWLIWFITQGTAAVASFYGGGKFGTISLIVGTILVFFITLLSFKYGTKNITKGDSIILILALLAIVFWWQLKNPVLAVIMISLIDGLGYIPTIRKTFIDPKSETVSFWILMVFVIILILLSNGEYNILTVLYPTILFVGNAGVLFAVFLGKKR